MKNIGGEFIIELADEELILRNQFTTIGAQQVYRAAFWQESLSWWVGLCAHNPADTVALESLGEPDGSNGYVRQNLAGNVSNWPTVSVVNGETYVESRQFTFPATGPYSAYINRLFITDGDSVIAISSALPDGLQIISADFTSRYRLYLR